MATKSFVIAEPSIVGTSESRWPTPSSSRSRLTRFGRVGNGVDPSGSFGSAGTSIPYAHRKSENASPCQSSS